MVGELTRGSVAVCGVLGVDLRWLLEVSERSAPGSGAVHSVSKAYKFSNAKSTSKPCAQRF